MFRTRSDVEELRATGRIEGERNSFSRSTDEGLKCTLNKFYDKFIGGKKSVK